MSQVKANSFTDASGGSNAVLYGVAAPANSMGNRNRIINGGMVIDQRNAGASVTVGPSLGGALYTLDRWLGFASSTRTFTVQQGTTAPTGFTNSAQLTVGVSGSPSAAEQNLFAQNIEGFNTADLGWGTASAQAVTISFWVRSSVTGTYGFGVHNSNGSRCYVATYVVNSANTWEYKTIVVPGDTSGTWLTNNGIGVNIRFDLGSGSNYNGTADTWSGSFVWRTSGCVNWIANAGATLNITGVQLEAGSVASPFERRDYGRELIMCERYCQSVLFNNYIGNGSGWYWSMPINFQTTMRSAPTFGAFFGGTTSNITYEAAESIGVQGCRYTILASGTNAQGIGRGALASSEL